MLIEELRHDRRYSKPALDEVQASVEDRRTQARDRLKERLSPAKLQKISRRLKRVAKHLEADDAGPRDAGNGRRARETSWALDARSARRGARVREAIDAAGIVYAAGPLHQLRIALKKFRFALELKAQLDQHAAARDITALKSSQDLLGRLHDLQVLIEHARDIQATRLFVDPAGWRELGSLVRVLERDCRTLHARYVRDAAGLADIAKGASQPKNRTARVA
jgi:CHAD domain-containing protein